VNLTKTSNADILSDMKTFTVRELDRQPSEVLDAADREGIVQVRRRDGRVYSVQPLATTGKITSLPDFQARIKKIFPKAIPKTQARMFDKLIASE
jgi:hypothetical protein